MPQASIAATISHTPPGAAAASSAAVALTASYAATEAGTLDIPDATSANTVFAIPFGTVNVDALALLIRNTNNQDMHLRINGSANLYRIPPNGIFLAAHPAAASGGGPTPILSASVVTSGVQSGVGTVSYCLFGN